MAPDSAGVRVPLPVQAQAQDICDGFRELGLSRAEVDELGRFYDQAPLAGYPPHDPEVNVYVPPTRDYKMVRVTQPKSKAAPASSRDEEPPIPLFVAQFWLRVANGLLWLRQRHCSAQGLRDLWSSCARLSNRLRKSHWEGYRRELGYIVGKNRQTAPKAKPGEAASAKLTEGHGKVGRASTWHPGDGSSEEE